MIVKNMMQILQVRKGQNIYIFPFYDEEIYHILVQDEPQDEKKYETCLKDIPALSLNKSGTKQQEEASLKKEEENKKVSDKKDKNKLRECLQGLFIII